MIEAVNSLAMLVLKDNVALVEGIDYRFGYNPSTNIIRITPIAGVWEQDSTYVVRMIDASDAIVAATDGVNYVDGDRLNVLDLEGGITSFEYEAGITISLSQTLTGAFADGVTFDVFDGTNLLNFELDNNQIFDTDRIPIAIPAAGTSDQVAARPLPTPSTRRQHCRSPLSCPAASSNCSAVRHSRLPSPTACLCRSLAALAPRSDLEFRFPAVGAAPSDTIADGQTFIVRRGAIQEVVFELDDNGSIDTPNATGVAIPLNPSLDQIADAIVRAVGGAGLGLSPENAGFGRVFLGGDIELLRRPHQFDAATTRRRRARCLRFRSSWPLINLPTKSRRQFRR